MSDLESNFEDNRKPDAASRRPDTASGPTGLPSGGKTQLNSPGGESRASHLKPSQPHSASMPTLATRPIRESNPSPTETTRGDIPSVEPKPVHRESASSGAYFLLATSVLLFAGWFIGPQIVEKYQYSVTKGRLKAEYETAVNLLNDQPLEQVSQAYQLVAHKVKPSVVSIKVRKDAEPGTFLQGYGSGVIMSPDGHIITNAHVLEGARRCDVELHDRRRYRAQVIGVDEVSDLAVLKIDANDLIPAEWGDSDEVNVGSIVWAIGSPYQYQQTVTSGILSGKDRPGDNEVGRKQNLLQTDAAVNPGNSGGPLVDANGCVIGINTSIFGDTFQGISFAVPSDTARFVYEQIRQSGTVVRGYLGVSPAAVMHWHAERLGLPDLDGALVNSVEPGTPAAQADLRQYDVIRSWNGEPVTLYNNLYKLAEMSPPNSIVNVTLIRDGEPRSTQVVIGELPQRINRRVD